MSQPFFVAEVFTGKPGNYTGLDETIGSFERIINGDADDVGEGSFLYVGGLDEAIEKSKAG